MTKLFSKYEHKGMIVGHPSVNGWMVDNKTIRCEDDSINARAYATDGNSRNYGVHVNGEFVGTVYCMTGGQYAAITAEKEQLSTYTGHDAEFKCFVDLVLSVEG